MTGRVLAACSSAVGFAGVVIYLSIINAQDGEISTRATGWATAMAIPATLALAAVFGIVDTRMRRWLLGIATFLNFGLGVLGIFSVGLIFILAGFLSAFGTAFADQRQVGPHHRADRRSSVYR